MVKHIVAIVACVAAGLAAAKLPPLSADAQAKADEAKAKSAWSDKVAAYQLCVAQDKVAAYYLKTQGKDSKPMPAPPCADPGPYVSAAAAPIAAQPAPTAPPEPPKK